MTKNNPLTLVINQQYLLRTYDIDGFEKDKLHWIKVIWNGKSLIDKQGMTWNEWLSPDYSDIFLIEN